MVLWYFLGCVLLPLAICLGIVAGCVFLILMALECYKEEFKK